jgi:hypothetical protein
MIVAHEPGGRGGPRATTSDGGAYLGNERPPRRVDTVEPIISRDGEHSYKKWEEDGTSEADLFGLLHRVVLVDDFA